MTLGKPQHGIALLTAPVLAAWLFAAPAPPVSASETLEEVTPEACLAADPGSALADTCRKWSWKITLTPDGGTIEFCKLDRVVVTVEEDDDGNVTVTTECDYGNCGMQAPR